jgi:hypothetical protein
MSKPVYVYDTEFIEDGHRIDLVSIGIVGPEGREYYAVVYDAPYHRTRKPEFAWWRKNVWPHLPTRQDTAARVPYPLIPDRRNPVVKMKAQIADEVAEFLTRDGPPALWADYSAYDHVALCGLWGPMVNKPADIPYSTWDLRQEWERQGCPDLPQQAMGEHHALADALHAKSIARVLGVIPDEQ